MFSEMQLEGDKLRTRRKLTRDRRAALLPYKG